METEDNKKDTVETCDSCGCKLHESEECYYINGEYYCRGCVESAIIILDYKQKLDGGIYNDSERIKTKNIRSVW